MTETVDRTIATVTQNVSGKFSYDAQKGCHTKCTLIFTRFQLTTYQIRNRCTGCEKRQLLE